jgi:hypothetical protein
VVSKIFIQRDEKVMIDSDLAELYGVEVKYLKRQVRRNIERFPEDFMFIISIDEYQESLRRQYGTLKRGQHLKYPPMLFTEQGVAQLSSVIKSDRAIKVNILIIRLFTRMRRLLMSHKGLMLKIEQIERGLTDQGLEIQMLFEYITKLNEAKEQHESQESRNGNGF